MQIFRYYLVEACLSVFIAFGLALLFTAISLPLAEQLFQVELDIAWLLQPSMLAIAALIAGSHTAFGLVPCKPDFSFKHHLAIKQNPQAHKSQCVIEGNDGSVNYLYRSAVEPVADKQAVGFREDRQLRFKTEQLMRINLPDEYTNFSVVKETFSKLPFITDLSLLALPGSGWSRSGAEKRRR